MRFRISGSMFQVSMRTRFVLGLSAMLLPLALLGASALFLLHYTTAALEEVVQEAIEEMHPVMRLQTLMLTAAMPINDYLIHGDPAEKDKFAHLTGDLDRVFEETLAGPFGLAQERDSVRAAREEWRLAKAIALPLLALPLPVGNPAAAQEIKRMDVHIDRAVELLGQVHDHVRQEVGEALAQAHAVRRWAYALVAGIFIAAIAIVAATAFALARSILLPLRALETGAKRFGVGDLSHRVELNKSDELGQLAKTFNAMAEALEMSRAALRIDAVAFETQEGILITDRDKRIIRVNRAFTRLTGYSAEEVIGRTPAMLQYERQDADFYRSTWETVARDKCWQGESLNRRKDGEFYPALLTITIVTDADGQVTNYVAMFADITLQKKEEEAIQKLNVELAELATRDGLTGLYNHRTFYKLLEDELARAQRFNRPLSLLLFDIDHFKRVNDTHGHLAGDAVLRDLGELLRRHARAIDRVCRYGGEEVTVILPESDLEAAVRFAERLRAAVEAQPFDVDAGAPLHMTVSIGVASWPAQAASAQTLVAAADAAMYAAKQSGRNRVVRYEPAPGQPS